MQPNSFQWVTKQIHSKERCLHVPTDPLTHYGEILKQESKETVH